MSWRAHLRPQLAALSVYHAPQRSARARMHANENPEPWPAHVLAELAELVRNLELGRYPDSSGRELREALALRHGCDPARIVLGNGSDEIISLLLTALGGAPEPVVVVPTPTFVMYGHSAKVLGYAVREVPLQDDFELDEAGLDRALVGATICFLARPNNPTGSLWRAETIERLIAAHPAVVFVIDEAYVAYAPGASMWRADRPDHVVHMGTLSKVGLAALRVGYGIAAPELAHALDKVRHPYNVSQTSLVLAHAVVTRFADVQAELVARAIAGRERLAALLATIPDAHVHPSSANLVLVRMPSLARATALVELLARADILVKGFPQAAEPLRSCVRVSVGTAAELDHLEATLRAATFP